MALEGSRLQFSKLGPATKMTLQANSKMTNNIIIQYGSPRHNGTPAIFKGENKDFEKKLF
jgi:hypothetical protein